MFSRRRKKNDMLLSIDKKEVNTPIVVVVFVFVVVGFVFCFLFCFLLGN